jgi:DNA polymerase zeta
MAFFKVRLNCVDQYQSTATQFEPGILQKGQHNDGKSLTFPVIRVFGATQTGQKVCAHIHGAFPYMYIDYDGLDSGDDVKAYLQRLRLSINYALTVSYRRTSSDDSLDYVAHISLVKGVPFYGYHLGFTRFLKIYLLNPLHINRLADLFRQGAVMKRAIQPYESHMQYIPQWMCDYNLFGCDYLECAKVKFRGPVPLQQDMRTASHLWHDGTIANSMVSDPDHLQRHSLCSIEIDVCVQDILNRLDIKSRDIHHDLLEKINPFTNEEKIVHSMAGLWRDETKRRKTRMGLPDSNGSPFPSEVLVTVSADPRNSSSGGWIHEREYRDKLEILAEGEKLRNLDTEKTYPDIKTSLQSVEDLYPFNLPIVDAFNGLVSDHNGVHGADNEVAVEVDESRVLSMHDRSADSQSDDGFELHSGLLDGLAQDTMNNNTKDGAKAMATHANPNLSAPILGLEGVHMEATKGRTLEELGIRNAGDYDFVAQDAFMIPIEFTSRPSAMSPVRKGKEDDSGGLGPTKRRKLLPKEESHESIHDEVEETRRGMNKGHAQDTNQSISSRIDVSPNKLRSSPGMADKLKFPVVKDPNDPYTVQRLSQQGSRLETDLPLCKKAGSSIRSAVRSRQDITSVSAEVARSQADSVCSEQTRSVLSMVHHSFDIRPQCQILCIPANAPPLVMPMSQDGLPSRIYQDAYYANEEDVSERSREYAGREFKLEGTTVPFLPDFDASGTSMASVGAKPPVLVNKHALDGSYSDSRRACTLSTWEIKALPPPREEIQLWLDRESGRSDTSNKLKAPVVTDLSQLEGPTQKNKYGAKYTEKKSSSNAFETQYMSIMSLEIHVNTRGNFVPDPEKDEIACIVWCLQSDDEELVANGDRPGTHIGIIACSEYGGMKHHIAQQTTAEVEEEASEMDLLTSLVDIVRHHDPDILTGFEVHGSSWGYLIERARFKYDFNLCDELSRMKSHSHGRFGKEADRWGFNHASTIRVTGRHMINIWRAMRGELNLLQYTMENIVFHLLQKRIPHYSFADLTRWYKSGNSRDLAKVLSYHLSRVQLDLHLLDENELVARTSEQARLLGIDFYSVFSRGSQFKVESLMLRIAKPENFILISPSRKQVGQQNALECLPLVMEPQSAFYTSPVLVLDFQSLYPSVMIAYNYCYSTYLGRVVQWRGQNKMGFTDYAREAGLIAALEGHINIAPNGIMYAKPEARKSLLAKMLGEILETRVMVKSGMKVEKDDRQLQRLLNNRQLALKLIANVTYGYTSASFSGRMPCSEIADSIVQTGREILEKSIALIHSVEKWGAEVVYGDTDSLFIHLKGRTRDEAFEIGKEIASTITEMNPRPIKLKFEKVYHPCVLLAKKRYVGFKYESPNQTTPDFDDKGIETVRRDGTPAIQKIQEKALKILFRTADLSQVKYYFQSQCSKLMRGRVSIQDFIFAREVKLGTYSDKGPPPPGALISAKRMLEDPRTEPQYGERVPWVVIAGAPGARLIDRSVAPEVLLNDDQNELDAEYYISKALIPPLERIFNLVGASVRSWFDEMPKFQRIRRVDVAAHYGLGLGLGPLNAAMAAPPVASKRELVLAKKTLESYMGSGACVVCKRRLEAGGALMAAVPVCTTCKAQPERAILTLRAKIRAAERTAVDINRICRSCAGLAFGDEVKCDSKDCPVFWSRRRHGAGLGSRTRTWQEVIGVLGESEEGLEW